MMMAKMLPVRLSHPSIMVKQEQDDDSDTDEPNLLLKKSDSSEAQIIHSGHFMVSSPHSEHPPKKGYDFDTVNEQACQTYSFGKTSSCHLSIDASLTKLLECMTLAYSGKLVSPKWKNFKGLKLQWRDKIRLNNAIWRAWYLQYIEKLKNPVCNFVTPLDASVDFEEHRRPEAIATDGKYWKRRIEIVVREYHKWRTYFKKRLQKHKDEDLSSLVKDDDIVPWKSTVDGRDTPVPMEEEPLLDMEMLMAEISDTLFSTIYSHQPNPKETAHAGNADMIQPELFPLQPNLDLMDTFESFQDIFSSTRFPGGFFNSTSNVSAVPLSDAALRPCSPVSQASALPSSTLAPVNLDEELIPSPGPPAIVPVREVRRERAASVGSLSTSQGPVKFNSETSISSQHGFVPVFSPSVPLFQTPAASPNVPPAPSLDSLPAFITKDGNKFPLCNTSVITHTASPTLTHNPSATTFSQSQNLILTTQQQVPCNISIQPAGIPQQTATQSHTYIAISKPGAKQKTAPQKIVPVIQPDTVSLVFAPASFPGQAQAVIMSPAPLKTDTVLAPRITQPNVVIAPATIAGTPAVPEFHGSILVGPAPQTQGSQMSQPMVPRIFPSPTSEPLVKREKTPSQSCSTAPSPASCRDCQNSRQGSPCASEHSLSPPHSSGKASSDSQIVTLKNQRLKHISAEQKRRFNIKTAFTTLNNIVASNTKPISHAITLQKTVDYIAKLQQERAHILEETRRLREEVEELNFAISSCQQLLPATGVPITPQSSLHMRDFFDKYVKIRTLQNWKFWIFSIIIKPLFESFNDMVSTASLEEMCSSTKDWLDMHCSLRALRPMVLHTLRQLSTTTSILTDPMRLPEQAKQAVSSNSKGVGET